MTLSRELKAGLDSFPFLGLLGSPGVLPTCLGDSDFSSLAVASVCLLRCALLEEPTASHTYSALSFISSPPWSGQSLLNVPIYSGEVALPEGFYVGGE